MTSNARKLAELCAVFSRLQEWKKGHFTFYLKREKCRQIDREICIKNVLYCADIPICQFIMNPEEPMKFRNILLLVCAALMLSSCGYNTIQKNEEAVFFRLGGMSKRPTSAVPT